LNDYDKLRIENYKSITLLKKRNYKMSKNWINRNRKYTLIDGDCGFSLNVAGMDFSDKDLDALSEKFKKAHIEMKKIEAGEIKNPDEQRQVTHFTDRVEYPKSDLFGDIEKFAENLRTGIITGSTGKKIDAVVINGIGGSALGPQLVQFAINSPYWNELSDEQRNGYLKIYFTDNTDSAGFADIMATINLETTIIASISKSGGTQETRNNTASFKEAYENIGLVFEKHACAITMLGSLLDKTSKENNWLQVFEMAESIGGRTSEMSVVGHLPAALAGVNFKSMLEGACNMDSWTRKESILDNPAYLLSAMWYIAGEGKGNKNMVIVPYADRLILLSRYFQQLVMESIGKELDLDGNTVHQGLNVFGNKGGTDAHAFIQQLNDGRNDFFITFIEVLKDPMNLLVEGSKTMGDYLHGFQAGLSAALRGKGRQVIEMTIQEVNEYNLGMIIALYERAVAAYAELININPFHQPGVQAYKLASKTIIDLLSELEKKSSLLSGVTGSAAHIADILGMQDNEIEIEGILSKVAENNGKKLGQVEMTRTFNENGQWIYSIK